MFILAPIFSELKIYWQRRDAMQWNKHTKYGLTLAILVLFFLVLPWKTSINVPAVVEFRQHTQFYVPESAQVKQLLVKNSQRVSKGALLITLESPELDYKIDQVEKDIKILEWLVRKEQGRTENLGIKQTDEEELARKNAELQALLEQKNDMQLTAPFAGKVVDLDKNIRQGAWLQKNTPLFELVNPNDETLTAFVPEHLVKKIRGERTAKFYPENLKVTPIINARLVTIDPVTTEVLDKPYLSSRHGGAVAVHDLPPETHPVKEAIYRIILKPETPIANFTSVTRGTVQLHGKGRSLLGRAWQVVAGVLVRESGF
jgi:putative peptide zinc metalloprotease protein